MPAATTTTARLSENVTPEDACACHRGCDEELGWKGEYQTMPEGKGKGRVKGTGMPDGSFL